VLVAGVRPMIFVHDGGLDIVFSQIVVPLLLLVKLLNGSLGGPVLPEKVPDFPFVPVFDDNHFFCGAHNLFVDFITFINFYQLTLVKYFQFLQFIKKFFFILMNKLNKFQIIRNGLIC
jgi:hypothetical protein